MIPRRAGFCHEETASRQFPKQLPLRRRQFWAASDPNAAVEYLQKISDGEAAISLLSGVVPVWCKTHPKKREFCSKLPAGDAQNRAAQQVASQWRMPIRRQRQPGCPLFRRAARATMHQQRHFKLGKTTIPPARANGSPPCRMTRANRTRFKILSLNLVQYPDIAAPWAEALADKHSVIEPSKTSRSSGCERIRPARKRGHEDSLADGCEKPSVENPIVS